jgi:integrase/recombinase XerC
MIYVKTHVVARRNARGRSAQEHLVAALRCLYRRAVSDGLIKKADNSGAEDRQAAAPDDHPTVTAWTAGTAREPRNCTLAAAGAWPVPQRANNCYVVRAWAMISAAIAG